MMGKCHCDTTVLDRRAATDRSRRWRANRHARHPGADVRCHRSAVPPPRQAAWRRHGGVRDDRLVGDDPREPARRWRWPRWTGPAASARCNSPAASPRRWPRRRGMAVDRGADLIDINFGCPVKKVALGQQAGSALMRDEAAAAAILEATVRAVRGAGDAEDAHGLGPCQPERAAACPHRRRTAASAWSPCMAAPASSSTPAPPTGTSSAR